MKLLPYFINTQKFPHATTQKFPQSLSAKLSCSFYKCFHREFFTLTPHRTTAKACRVMTLHRDNVLGTINQLKSLKIQKHLQHTRIKPQPPFLIPLAFRVEVKVSEAYKRQSALSKHTRMRVSRCSSVITP